MHEIRVGESTFVYCGDSERQAKSVFSKYKEKINAGIVNDSVFWIKDGIVERVHTPQESFLSKLEPQNE